MKPFDYLIPRDLDTALGAYSDNGSTLKAGGIDLVDLMKEGIAAPGRIVNVGGLSELAYIREEGGALRIGSTTTLADIGRSDIVRRTYAGLAAAAAGTATPQVRERATLGGNLCQRPRCWYFRSTDFHCWKKDGPVCYAINGENKYHAILGGGPCHIVHPSNCAPALVALAARFRIRRGSATRDVPATEFFVLPRDARERENILEPGDILTEVVVPQAPSASATVELREKQSFDWPLALASVARLNGSWRICLGAVSPIPWLCREAGELLGQTEMIGEELAAGAGEAAVRGAQPMTDNAYKVQLAKVAVKRALLAACGQEIPT